MIKSIGFGLGMTNASSSPSTSQSQIKPPVKISDKDLEAKKEKFQNFLASPSVKMEELKKICWNGIPDSFRAECWRLLLGYTPLVRERWESTISAKRQSYWSCVPLNLSEEYIETLHTDYEKTIFHQIHIDVPRTNPSVKLFHLPLVQKAFERILYLWAIRHPASGYVQGINDLVTPFYAVFLRPFVTEPIESLTDISHIEESTLKDIEADCYWCLTLFIDSIQDHYTFAQPGIQKMIFKLKELIKKIDDPLNTHLSEQKIEYIQFAFRWMNCLLMREFPLSIVIRIWDTYLSEDESFSILHVYLCAAFLLKWSPEVKAQEFQDLMLFLQNLPTQNWTEQDIETLLSQAYVWKTLYNDSGHLKSNKV
uniref:Rab-GAP TBC domain-containing protein n=1 Tax=Arcella intermedia TaxID=1963864 RepID=A0A6B2L7D3_9EUKA